MKLDLAKVNYEGEWFSFGDDGRLKVRPFPRSKSKFKVVDGALIFGGTETLDTFKYCLVDWEGFVDPAGKPIKLTETIKEKLFDSGLMGIADFVIQKNIELQKATMEEEKN